MYGLKPAPLPGDLFLSHDINKTEMRVIIRHYNCKKNTQKLQRFIHMTRLKMFLGYFPVNINTIPAKKTSRMINTNENNLNSFG